MKKQPSNLKSRIENIGFSIKNRVFSYSKKGSDFIESAIVRSTNLDQMQIDSLKKLLLTYQDNKDSSQREVIEWLKKYMKQSRDLSLKDLKAFSEIPFEYWQGLLFYQAKDWKNAEFYFRKAVENKPEHAYSNFKLGMSLFKQKNWSLAFEYISIAVNLNPKIIKWHIQLRQSEVRLRIQDQKNAKKAIRQQKQLDSHAQNDAEPIDLPSNTMSDAKFINNYSAADIKAILIEQLEKYGASAEIYSSLAKLQQKQNKLWQAVDSWRKAIELSDDNPEWLYHLGETYEKLGHYHDANLAYQSAIDLSLDDLIPAEWYYRLGYTFENQSHDNIPDFVLANKAYSQAIARDKKLKAAQFGIGVFHAARRDWQKAIAAYEHQVKNIQNNAELYYRLGFAYDRNYQWGEAERFYRKAIDLENNPDWVFRLAFSQEKQEKYHEAAFNYKLAAESRVRYTPYWFYRAAYSFEQQGLYEQAVELYLALRKDKKLDARYDATDPNSLNNLIYALKTKHNYDVTDANSWFELGNVYEALGEWSRAEGAYYQAVARSSELKSLWYYRLGFVLAKQNKFIESCQAFRSYRVMQRPHGVSENILGSDLGFAEAASYSEYYAVLPVRENTVLYESFSGQSMSCNPYALFMHLFEHPDYKNWTHIWVINQKDRIPNEYKKYTNIVFVERGSDNYLRYLVTTKVLINNSNFPPCFIRKPEQKFLSTWHGTPFKTLGRDMEGRFFEHKNLTRNILQSTHLLSPNSHTSRILYDRHDIKDIYNGKLLEVGYPRIDITLNQSNAQKGIIREKLGVKEGEMLIFYAPTWRGTHDDIDFDYERLESDLNKLSSIPYSKLIFRGHSLLQESLKEVNLEVTVAPESLDTNEILGVTDILITDYSSVLFDYLPMLKPLVLYMYDLKEYSEERGLYFDACDLPGEKCYNIDELLQVVSELVVNKIGRVSAEQNKVLEFAPYDDGKVSERVVKAVFEDDYDNIKVINDVLPKKSSILIYGGPFMGNGITTSVLNLISNIDPQKYTISLVIDPGSIEKEHGRLMQFAKIPSHINVIARVGRMDMTLEDRYIHGLNNQDFELQSGAAQEVLHQSWKQEYQRVFGNARFDSLIHFEGYNRFWAGVFTSITDKKKTFIYMHNSMEEEYRLKYPYLKAIFGYARLANKVISVSELTMQLNKERLANKFNIPVEKFDYADNLQQPEYIKSLANESLLAEDIKYFDTKGKIFLTIGRLSMEKDHTKLIDAFSNIVKSYPDSRLLIVGDGALRHALSQQIAELKLENQVHLLGLRSNPFPLLKKADCFVLSSNHEGQPMTLFEAMILEKMIIATDIVGSRGVLENRSGYLVENSASGLAQGLADFLAGKLTLTTYDIEEYQQQAINRFYHLIN